MSCETPLNLVNNPQRDKYVSDDLENYEDGCGQCRSVISRSWYQLEMASREVDGTERAVNGVVCEACFDALSEPIPETVREMFKTNSRLDFEYEDDDE